MSVYFESVRIAGIMGIPNELPIDLTAPLTLIYAPNGTGKTSAWTAIKSLMTMGVDASIVCRAAGALPGKVAGELMIGDVRYCATATDGNLTLSSEFGDSLTGTAALAQLAPEVDTTSIQTRGGVLKGRLISQIEGCRFLPSESLLYLIDSGEESTELRRKLFADLTGTSAIQAEVRETRRYRDKLSQELGNVTRSLQTIEDQMEAFTVAENPNSTDSLQLIGQAASVARIQLPTDVPAQEALSLLREIQNSRAASLEMSRGSYTTWRSIESTFPELDHDLAVASAALKDAIGARERAEKALDRARSELLTKGAKRAREQYDSFQQGLAKLAGLVAAEGRTKQVIGSSLALLRQLLQPFDSESAIESRLGALQRLNVSRHKYREQVAERGDLLERSKKLLETLRTSSRDLQERLNEKIVEHSELSARFTRQSDLAASLRASAQSLVTASRSSNCPCCSHDWQSVDALLFAIAAGDQSGHTDPRLKQELEAAEAEIGHLQVQYAAASVTEEQLRDMENRLGKLNSSIEQTERLALTNDIQPARLLEVAETLDEVYTFQSYLDFWRILEVLDYFNGDLDETLSVDAALSALSVRGEELKSASALAEQAEAECRLIIEREQGALQSSSENESRCEAQAMKLTRLKHERDAAIEQLRAMGLFAGPQTAATLSEAMTTLEKLNNLITQISAVAEASAAIAAHERIAANHKTLQSRQDRIGQELEQANRLIAMLTQAEKQAGTKFFDKLLPAVGTLFDHMQVNRVFRKLEISAVKESFRLDGHLDDDVSLDPGLHFSQGQRQDLALSMFLVRAASLGGSFFLDEPLVHLDDLNRTALLDCLRACVLGTASAPRPVRLVVTTANWGVARHLMQKFSSVRQTETVPWLRVIQLCGNVRHGLDQSVVFPTGDKHVEMLVH